MPDKPTIFIPEEDTLVRNLSASIGIEDRVRYVQRLLRAAEDVQRVIDQYEKEVQRFTVANNSMTTELHALRTKMGDLGPEERAAVDARYEMLGKMTRARNEVDVLQQSVNDAIRRFREVLAK